MGQREPERGGRITDRTSLADTDTVLDGRYRLERLLGRGGMGEVYAARDERLDRNVAIKIFPPYGEPGCEVERTRAELDALAPLDHPHIVALYDAGCAGGRQYFVLQYVDGPTVASRIVAGNLTFAEVAKIGQGAASALAYLHARGIVHRDVKPSNVLLDADGNAYLSDFGTARHTASPHLTATGETIGTASYLSPEQVRGFGVGPPTDVYALGLVLLECLTGRREYDGTPAEAAISRLSRRPAIDARLPRGWRDMLARMTDDDPAQRPSAVSVAAWFADQAESAGWLLAAGEAVAEPAAAHTAVLPATTSGAVVSRLRTLAWMPRGHWLRAAVGVVVVAVVAVTAAFLPDATHGTAGSSRSNAPASTPAAAATHTPTPSPTAVRQVAPVAATTAPAPPPADPHAHHGHPGPGHGHGHG